MSKFQQRYNRPGGRFGGQAGGRSSQGGRYQSDDRVSSVEERGYDQRYGSWDGDPGSIPGAVTINNLPNMTDDVNREAFLGETQQDRAFQRAVNIARGVIQRDGIDPQELIAAIENGLQEQEYSSGSRMGRTGARGSGRSQQPQGQGRNQGRFQGRTGTKDPFQLIQELEGVHQEEEECLQLLDRQVEQSGQGNYDLDQIMGYLLGAAELSGREAQIIQQLANIADVSEAEEANRNEMECLHDLMNHFEQNNPSYRQIDTLMGELASLGQAEAQAIDQIAHEASQSGGNRSSRGGGSQRGGTPGRRPSNQGGGRGSHQSQGQSRGRYEGVTMSGQPDRRNTEARDEFTRQRFGRPGNLGGGEEPVTMSGQPDRRNIEARNRYTQERYGRSGDPKDN